MEVGRAHEVKLLFDTSMRADRAMQQLVVTGEKKGSEN